MTLPVTWIDFIPLVVFCPVLAAAAWSDLSRMKIPNQLVYCGIAVFILTVPTIGLYEATLRLMIGAACFALCLVLFAFRLFGGGDAKFLPVVVVFVPSVLLPFFLYSFGVSLLLGMVLMWMLRKFFARSDAPLSSLLPGAHFPMGVSFALSFVIFCAWVWLGNNAPTLLVLYQ